MKKYLGLTLFMVAFSERVIFDLGPNVELVTVSLLLASFYLGVRHSVKLVIAILILSDLILGTTSIFIFTWTGFVVPALVSGYIFNKYSNKSLLLKVTAMGAGTSLFFYFWTNFGVWLSDSWGMYANDISGLVAAYINGLPFLKLNLVSSLFFVPLGFTAVEYISSIYPSLQSKLSPLLPNRGLLVSPSQIKSHSSD